MLEYHSVKAADIAAHWWMVGAGRCLAGLVDSWNANAAASGVAFENRWRVTRDAQRCNARVVI